ncbi:MAG TPA: hypothetical protein VJT32_16140 [bacterium]|nr:hypothetical protein [bacterium]
MERERRTLTSLGRKRRRDFERSVKKLRDLGLSEWTIDYYRRASRMTGVLPHTVVCQVAMIAAGRELSKAAEAVRERAHPTAGPGGAPAPDPATLVPSYQTIRTLRRRVTHLWHEIQGHESMAMMPPPEDRLTGALSTIIGRGKLPRLGAASKGAGPAAPRTRKRSKIPPRQH